MSTMIAIYIGKIRNDLEIPNNSRVATPRRSEAKYCNSFQLTHRPRGNHAQSIASNGDQKDDKTLLQHSQLSQHGEFWHVSVSERQRSRPCGQNLRVHFPKNGTATGSRRERSSNGGRRRDKSVHISTTKASFSTIILILCHCIIAIATV